MQWLWKKAVCQKSILYTNLLMNHSRHFIFMTMKYHLIIDILSVDVIKSDFSTFLRLCVNFFFANIIFFSALANSGWLVCTILFIRTLFIRLFVRLLRTLNLVRSPLFPLLFTLHFHFHFQIQILWLLFSVGIFSPIIHSIYNNSTIDGWKISGWVDEFCSQIDECLNYWMNGSMAKLSWNSASDGWKLTLGWIPFETKHSNLLESTQHSPIKKFSAGEKFWTNIYVCSYNYMFFCCYFYCTLLSLHSFSWHFVPSILPDLFPILFLLWHLDSIKSNVILNGDSIGYFVFVIANDHDFS